MKAAIFKGEGEIAVEERPKPTVQEPTDAIVRVVLACVCGSDLWFYRGISDLPHGGVGHEFIGVVDEIGSDVTGLAVGDFVISPFSFSDGTARTARQASRLRASMADSSARAATATVGRRSSSASLRRGAPC